MALWEPRVPNLHRESQEVDPDRHVTPGVGSAALSPKNCEIFNWNIRQIPRPLRPYSSAQIHKRKNITVIVEADTNIPKNKSANKIPLEQFLGKVGHQSPNFRIITKSNYGIGSISTQMM